MAKMRHWYGLKSPDRRFSPEIAESSDDGDDIQVEECPSPVERRGSSPHSRSAPSSFDQLLPNKSARIPQDQTEYARLGRLKGDSTRDALSIGEDEPRRLKKWWRASGEQQVDNGGDEYSRPTKRQRRPASQPRHLLKRRKASSSSSVLKASLAEDSDGGSSGESDESYKPHATYRKKQLGHGRRRCRSTQSLDLSSRPDTDETSSTHRSDTNSNGLDLPIRGSLGVRVIGLETFYTLNFCQVPLQSSSSGRHPHTKLPGRLACSRHARKTGPAPRPRSNGSKFTTEEDDLLVNLKGGQGLSWKEIEPYFPRRSVGALQVHYSTKLKAKARGSRERRGRAQ
jgi:hypothetical protein